MGYNAYNQRQHGSGEGPMAMGQGVLSSDTILINDISKAIIAEVHAYNFYQRLAELATNRQYQQVILRIQRDEARHYRWFSMILRRLGGQQPRIPEGEVPEEFKEGVQTAIRDELEAASFYQDIASRATERYIQMHFMRAARDEQRHASWLRYMLMNL